MADIEVIPKPNRLGDNMIRVYDNEMGALVGTITEEQLQFLIDQLEETSISDQDYYLDENTLAVLEGAGAEASLMDLLRSALGDRSDCEIRWSGPDTHTSFADTAKVIQFSELLTQVCCITLELALLHPKACGSLDPGLRRSAWSCITRL